MIVLALADVVLEMLFAVLDPLRHVQHVNAHEQMNHAVEPL